MAGTSPHWHDRFWHKAQGWLMVPAWMRFADGRARANQFATTKRKRQKARGQPCGKARTFAALNGLLGSTFVTTKAPVIARNHACQGGAQTAVWRASNTLTCMGKSSGKGAALVFNAGAIRVNWEPASPALPGQNRGVKKRMFPVGGAPGFGAAFNRRNQTQACVPGRQ